MQWNALVRDFSRSSTLTREMIQLMDGTLRYTSEVHAAFIERLTQQPTQSALETMVEEELRPRLFNEAYCARIQPFLTALRRSLLRLENDDLRTQAAKSGNDLTPLISIAEKIEALFQKYWEFHRYHHTLQPGEVIGLLFEINAITTQWQLYVAGFRHTATLLQQHLPNQEASSIRLCMQLQQPIPPTIIHVRALLDLVDCLHQWIGHADGEKTPAPPTMLHMETSPAIVLEIGVLEGWRRFCQRMLQHLFLKDVLGEKALVKVLLETAWRDICGNKVSPHALNKTAKRVHQCLATLPLQAAFQVADLHFPTDSPKVLKDLLHFLAEREISSDVLLDEGRTKKKARTAQAKPSHASLLDPASEGSTGLQTETSAKQTASTAHTPSNSEEKVENAIGVLTGSL